MEFTIELESPNFDIAVEKAIKRADDSLDYDSDKVIEKVEFVNMWVNITPSYSRENLYYYKFKVSYRER